MEQHRTETLPLWIAALMAAVVACYVLGYLYAGTVRPLGPGIVRTYRGQVLFTLFGPATVVESWARGEPVYIGQN
jgi:hypothetical protein